MYRKLKKMNMIKLSGITSIHDKYRRLMRLSKKELICLLIEAESKQFQKFVPVDEIMGNKKSPENKKTGLSSVRDYNPHSLS
jgi:hypothetical protein